MQQHFQRHLVDVMYLLALHLGSPTAAIAESARFALQHVAEASGCTSVADLLGRNADYIINDIGLKIK